MSVTLAASIEQPMRKRVTFAPDSGVDSGYDSPDTEFDQISMAELRAHNVPESAWFVVRGKVYDLTTFISRHPGGSAILLAGAGRDVTQVFEGTHTSVQRRILE